MEKYKIVNLMGCCINSGNIDEKKQLEKIKGRKYLDQEEGNMFYNFKLINLGKEVKREGKEEEFHLHEATEINEFYSSGEKSKKKFL